MTISAPSNSTRLLKRILALREQIGTPNQPAPGAYTNGQQITGQDFKNAEKHELLKPQVIAGICVAAVAMLCLLFVIWRVCVVRPRHRPPQGGFQG
ncbi:MAG: hypothetical protein LQ338_003155 [Usnochroma carphineum]|nr:MAG: hypothetical protein LQ338_003155 [Usnochroma carphineum]